MKEAKKSHNIKSFVEESWQKQKQNKEEFELSNQKSSLLKVNDYCYVDFNEKLFDKSFDVKVSLKSQKIYYFCNFLHNISP